MMWSHFDGLVWAEPGMVHGVVFRIFLISAVVALIAWIAGFVHRAEAHPPPERALDILKLRYAKGEIGREQFDEMKRELQS
jgi:putative membrane protein